jgi:hypothetical protein
MTHSVLTCYTWRPIGWRTLIAEIHRLFQCIKPASRRVGQVRVDASAATRARIDGDDVVESNSMPKKSVLIFCLAAAAVIGGLARWMWSGNEAGVPMPTPADIRDESADTIASKSQWQNFANTKPARNTGENSAVAKPRPTGEAPSNVVGIDRILQSMKLDANGRLVLDAP